MLVPSLMGKGKKNRLEMKFEHFHFAALTVIIDEEIYIQKITIVFDSST